MGFEYFLGTDPGIGKAGSLDIANGNSVSGNYNLTLGQLPVGFHWLGIRPRMHREGFPDPHASILPIGT